MEKHLILESTILLRDDSIWLVSNILACYDCHIQEIRDVLLRSYGVNGDTSVMLMKVLEEIEIEVQTAYRVSKDTYKSTKEQVYYEIGQGNLVSVFICQFGTLVIFYLLEEEFRG